MAFLVCDRYRFAPSAVFICLSTTSRFQRLHVKDNVCARSIELLTFAVEKQKDMFPEYGNEIT